jgi:hypothetical protein
MNVSYSKRCGVDQNIVFVSSDFLDSRLDTFQSQVCIPSVWTMQCSTQSHRSAHHTLSFSVDALFEALSNAFEANLVTSNDWMTQLHPRYHHFSGDYHGFADKSKVFPFEFDLKVKLQMAPPLSPAEKKVCSRRCGSSLQLSQFSHFCP